jgi:hypothetical protein
MMSYNIIGAKRLQGIHWSVHIERLVTQPVRRVALTCAVEYSKYLVCETLDKPTSCTGLQGQLRRRVK